MKKYIIASSIALLSLISVAGAQEFTFVNNLSVGIENPDVTFLQSWLISNGYDIPAISSGAATKGYFGAQTKVALMRYQSEHGIPGTGYFGPMTRAKFNERKVNDSRAPVINGIDAPTSLNINEMGTWSVRATDPQRGTLTYTVDWGDVERNSKMECPQGYICTPVGTSATPSVQQGSTFTHAYSDAHTYKVRFTVTNSLGLSAESSATVQINGSNASPLNLISPNGGEEWQKGTTQNIKWNSSSYVRATNADIILVQYLNCPIGMTCVAIAPMSYTIASNVNINQNSYNWNVGNVWLSGHLGGAPESSSVVPNGQYTIQICETGTTNCDSSNKPFTITSASPIVKVMSPNGGENWLSNSAHQISWHIKRTENDTNTKVDLYLDQENISVNCVTSPCPMLALRAPYLLDKNISINTSYNWIVATDINNVVILAGNYRVRVCLAGSTTNCDSSDTYFTISAKEEIVPDINIIFPNGRESYNVGDRATIRWRLDGTMRPGYKILLSLNPGMGYITTVPATDTSYLWTIPEGICLGGDACTTLASGSYKIYAQLYDGTPCVGLCAPTFPLAKLLAYDESDRNFTINME